MLSAGIASVSDLQGSKTITNKLAGLAPAKEQDTKIEVLLHSAASLMETHEANVRGVPSGPEHLYALRGRKAE